MDIDKAGEQSPGTGSQTPEAVEESKELSRRRFIRKSAEVAVLSLFGVMGFDAVTDKVLNRIAESDAAGRLSDVAARALKEHRLDRYANAATNCPRNYSCLAGTVTCIAYFVCETPGAYGCTSQGPRTFNCSPGDEFGCTSGFSCQGLGEYFKCIFFEPENCTGGYNPNWEPPTE